VVEAVSIPGMDVIGMTNLQEAKLAREAEIYATFALSLTSIKAT
jgi:purine nucleoside phosphorylase